MNDGYDTRTQGANQQRRKTTPETIPAAEVLVIAGNAFAFKPIGESRP